jgi:tight adherence protein B
MLNFAVFAAYAVAFVAALLIADAAIAFIRGARGVDDRAVERRLIQERPTAIARVDILRSQRGANRQIVELLGPAYAAFSRFVLQSHLGFAPERVLGTMGLITLVAIVALAPVLPGQITWAAFLFAPIIGVGGVMAYIGRARAQLRTKFEEQLPDALDLIVRSLKIGHSVSSAIGLIAKEMPAPIGPEFAIVSEQIAYGRDLAPAIQQMQERVPAPDLAYFSMAIQIQLESGGNLVESLQKLSNVIRDRYRMFRKVHAITAEGRFSAWALSIFPFLIGAVITLIKPDYYSQVSGEVWFPYIVVAVVLMLVINVVMMRLLTTIKV